MVRLLISVIVVANKSVLLALSLDNEVILSFNFLYSAVGVFPVDVVVNSESCFLVWSIALSIDPTSFFKEVLILILSLKSTLSLESVIWEFTLTTLKFPGETTGAEGVCP